MQISVDEKKNPSYIAEEAKGKGDAALKVCYLLCKCDPDYLGAVPSYERAAKNFGLAKRYEDEIYCREKLILCHREIKDTYSEGRNYERIAMIYVQNLNDYDSAYKYIENAILAFRTKGDYHYEINCLVTMAQNFKEKDKLDYAEKTLKLAHDEIAKISHIVTLSKEHSYDYIYKAMNLYCSVLILLNKLKETINICQEFIKAFEEYEENKSKIIVFYGLIAISFILIEDESNAGKIFEESKKICQVNSDYETMNNISDCWNYLKQGNEERFNMALRVVDVDYDNALVKKIKAFFTYYKGKTDIKDNKGGKDKGAKLDISIKSNNSLHEKDTKGNFADAQL